MKKCTYCGVENANDAVMCSTCHTPFAAPNSPPSPTSNYYLISPEEQRFWARMTFRQFAVLIIRLQALWLFFNAVLDGTYLPYYIREWTIGGSFTRASPAMQLNSWMLLLRIALNVIGGIALILHTEKLLSWMIKDLVPQQPPDLSPKTSA